MNSTKKNSEWTAEAVRQHALQLREGMRAVALTNYEEAVRLQKVADDVGGVIVRSAEDFASQSEQLAAKITSAPSFALPKGNVPDRIAENLARENARLDTTGERK